MKITLSTGFLVAVALSGNLISSACIDDSCFGGLLLGDGTIFGTSVEKTYNQINDYLVESFSDDDPERNLRKAIEWLQSKPKRLLSTNGHVEALRLLEKLGSLKEDTKCDGESLVIMKENNRATGYKANKPKRYTKSLRRIDQLVQHYSEDHANRCLNIHPIKFRSKYDQLEQKEYIRLVETFTKGHLNAKINYIQSHFDETIWTVDDFSREKLSKCTSLFHHIMTSRWFNSSELYDAINYFAKEDPNVKFMRTNSDQKSSMVREDKISALFNKYFAKPCRYYTQQLGPDIFEPAIYDSEIIDEDVEYHDADRILSELDYYIGRVCFRICSSLEYRSKSLLKDLKYMAANPIDRRNLSRKKF